MASPRTRKVLKEVRAQDENNVSVDLWAGLGWLVKVLVSDATMVVCPSSERLLMSRCSLLWL